MAADWSVECSSDSDGEQFFQALGEHFKSQVKGQYIQTPRERVDMKLDCIMNIKRKKRSKKQHAVGKPDLDIGASDSTLSDMRSPLSSGGREPPQNIQQRRNLSAFEYDDFPALTSTVKPHSNKTKRSPVVKRKKGGKPVVAQLDRVVSNYTRHKLLDQQQIKMSEQENLQQRLQTLPLPAAMVIGRTNESPVKPTDLSFDSDSDKDSTSSSPNLIENSLQSQIRKVGQLLENDGLT